MAIHCGFTPFGPSAVSVSPHCCSRRQHCSDSNSDLTACQLRMHHRLKTSGWSLVISCTSARNATPDLHECNSDISPMPFEVVLRQGVWFQELTGSILQGFRDSDSAVLRDLFAPQRRSCNVRNYLGTLTSGTIVSILVLFLMLMATPKSVCIETQVLQTFPSPDGKSLTLPN